jgi:hypothetical protein
MVRELEFRMHTPQNKISFKVSAIEHQFFFQFPDGQYKWVQEWKQVIPCSCEAQAQSPGNRSE